MPCSCTHHPYTPACPAAVPWVSACSLSAQTRWGLPAVCSPVPYQMLHSNCLSLPSLSSLPLTHSVPLVPIFTNPS